MSVWHRHFGHKNTDAVSQLNNKEMARNMQIKPCNNAEKCIQAKGTRSSFNKHSTSESKKPVNSQLCLWISEDNETK